MNKKLLFVWMAVLTALAGLINGITVFVDGGTTVSHVTGLVSKFAGSIAAGNLSDAWSLLLIILSFLVGAIISGFITKERSFYLHKSYGFIIITVGLLLVGAYFLEMTYRLLLLAFLMGLQNGMVVSFNGVVVRMTHMTGNLTDLGVFIGYRIRGNKNEKLVTGLVPLVALLSFIIGGIAGVLLHNSIGAITFVIAAVLYVLLGCIYFYLQKICIDKNFNGIADSEENL